MSQPTNAFAPMPEAAGGTEEDPGRRVPGMPSWRWVAAILGFGGLLALGLYAYVHQEHHGEIVTAMRTNGQGGAAWALYIAFLIYFIGVSFAGVGVATIVHIFGTKAIHSVARMAELMSILALAMAGMCVMADQGRPLDALMKLPAFTRVGTPFFGTFVLLASYTFASVIFLFLDTRADAAALAERTKSKPLKLLYTIWAAGYRDTPVERYRHYKVCWWMAMGTLPLLVIEQSTIGFIFGIQGGRPGWFSALQAPSFLVLAGVSGIGMLLIVASIARRFLALEHHVDDKTFKWLANLLLILTAIYIYFIIAEEMTAFYTAAVATERAVAREVVLGTYSPLFWTAAVSFLVAFLLLFSQFLFRYVSIPVVVTCGVLVNVGAFLRRYLLVVPSQTHGQLTPIELGHYAPTWVEWSVVAGAFSVGGLAYLVFARLMPLVPGHEHHEKPAEREVPWWRAVRVTLFGVTLGAGVTLAIAAFLSAARVGTEKYNDPYIPYSPALFILGIMLMFVSAAVYETFPTKLQTQPVTGEPMMSVVASPPKG